MAVVFYDVCFTFPTFFIGTYIVFMSLKRRSTKARLHVVPFLMSTAVMSFALGLLGCGIYASKIEPNSVEVTHTEISTPYLKAGTPPLKIVQLSDLHIEGFGYRERRALQFVKEAKPDIIVLTGDYTNSWKNTPHVQRFLKALHAKYGVYAVHGNWNPPPRSEEFFTGTSIHVLNNRSESIRTRSGRVVIGGIFWYPVQDAGRALAGVDTRGSYVILLSHMPDAALHVPRSVDLVLAGHTHGGQVRLPLIGPIVTYSAVGRHRSAGLSKLDNGGYLYVNRGLGLEGGWAPRIRFICRPEVTVLTIKPLNTHR